MRASGDSERRALSAIISPHSAIRQCPPKTMSFVDSETFELQ